MYLLKFSLLHMARNWRINLVILAALTLSVALLAGLPIYAQSMADQSLRQSIASHSAPGARNLQLASPPGGELDESSYAAIQAELGDLLLERIKIRQVILPDHQPALPPGEPAEPQKIQFYHLWAFDDQAHRITVLEGRLPTYTPIASQPPGAGMPVFEVCIGADGASRSGLKIGDHVTADGPNGPIILNIVGIIEPISARHDMWWGDRTTFGMHVKLLGRSKEIFTLSLQAASQMLQEVFPEQESSWRILLAGEKISSANAQQVQEAISRLQTRFRSLNVELSSGLPAILGSYRAELSTVRAVLLLLNTQTFLFALYAIWMITAFLMERSQRDLITLAGRGASRLQTHLVFALQGLTLAALAGAWLGPWLAQASIKLWAAANGMQAVGRFPPESWWLAAGAALFGWLAILLQVASATGQNLLTKRRMQERSQQRAGWQRLYIDLVLLIFGGLAYWQLSQAGGFVTSQLGTARLVDPFLLLSTTVLMLAAALACLRIVPYLLDLIAFASRQRRGLVAYLSLAHLARAPLAPSRVMLLVSLSATLMLFATTFAPSLRRSQVATAQYQAGADLRLASPAPSATAILERLSGLPAVRTASPVVRAQFSRLDSKGIDLLAIDPSTFLQVAHFLNEQDVSRLASLAQILSSKPDDSSLPGIFSRALLRPQHQVGQKLTLSVAGRQLDFEIRAIVEQFPTLGEYFVVTDINALAKRVNTNTLYFSGEAWLSVDYAEAAQYLTLLEDELIQENLLADAQAQLLRLQADPLAQGILGAFELSALVLSLFSVITFLVAHYLAAQQRTYEFGLLRSMGLGGNQAVSLFILEGMLMVALGLLLGTAIGYGLVQITFPGIAQTLAGSLTGVTIQQVVIDWGAFGAYMALLAACDMAGLLVLLLSLLKAGIQRVLRLGEE